MLQSRDKFKAGATSLEVIRNPQKYLDDHEAFELFELEEQIKRGGKDKFRFDLKYRNKQTEGTILFVDTKNYESLSGIFSGKNLDQLKAYFREITDFSQLRIVQQKRGSGMTIESFQVFLRKALLKETEAIYKSNEALFNAILDSSGDLVVFDQTSLKLYVESSEFLKGPICKILRLSD